MKRVSILGAVSALFLVFPVAALCAVFYRLPAPFADGPVSGVAALPNVVLLALIPGIIFGGFLFLAAAGAVLGAAAQSLTQAPLAPAARSRREIALGMLAGFAVDLVVVAVLAHWNW